MTGNIPSFILANGDHQNVDEQFLAELHDLAHKAQAEFNTEMPKRPTLQKLEGLLATMTTDTNWGRLYADFWQVVCRLMSTKPARGQSLVTLCLQTLDDRAHAIGVGALDRHLAIRLLRAVELHAQPIQQPAAQPHAA